MIKIDFKNLQPPAISEETLEALQDNIEEAIEGEVLFKNEVGTNGDITLSNTVEEYDEIEIFFDNDRGTVTGERIFSNIKVMKPNGKYVTLETSKAGSVNIYKDGQEYKISGDKLSVVHFYNLVFNGNTVSTSIDYQGFIRIFKIVGYKNRKNV